MTARFRSPRLISIADRVARVACRSNRMPTAQASSPTASTPVFALVPGQRELRLDLFRGLALWLIYIDHVSPDVLTWFTIRNYGFSDAGEIFVFISRYTAAL